MSRRRSSNPFDSAEEADMDISSLIDIAFLLLIYFLVTMQLIKQEQDINLVLPGVATNQSDPVKVDQMLIKITPDALIMVNGEVVDSDPNARTLAGLDERLERYSASVKLAGADALIVVDTADEAPQQRFIDVLNSCAKFGMNNVSLSQ